MRNKNKKTETKFDVLGWKCPVCGRGNSPFTSTCPCVQTPALPPYRPPEPYKPLYPETPWYPSGPWITYYGGTPNITVSGLRLMENSIKWAESNGK